MVDFTTFAAGHCPDSPVTLAKTARHCPDSADTQMHCLFVSPVTCCDLAGMTETFQPCSR
ncbi:hypothetical protein J6590_088191 [Homalodisca vitripennis]|nr:hypothetical protein J6590_088191 [Homalodisca vitripennis]